MEGKEKLSGRFIPELECTMLKKGVFFVVGVLAPVSVVSDVVFWFRAGH